jgi:hypothetical protein
MNVESTEDLRLERDKAQNDASRLRGELAWVTAALERSIRLQSHYARLLNMYDSGERMSFENAEAWLARLKEEVDAKT